MSRSLGASMRITASRQEICCSSTFDRPTLLGTWIQAVDAGAAQVAVDQKRALVLARVGGGQVRGHGGLCLREGEALVSSTLRRRRSKSVSRIELRRVRMASS